MINLLPQKEKYSLAQAKKVKQILVLSFMAIALLFMQELILFAIKINLEGRVLLQEALLQVAQSELEGSEEKRLEEEITFFLDAASQIDNFYQARVQLTPVLEKLNGICPPAIQLEGISYNESSGAISITGFSPERGTLLILKDRIEDEFIEVEFPSSNWVKAEDIKFSVSFMYQNGR